MERLTYRDANGELWYSDNGTERDRLHRLAAYEDTGFTPEEVQQMRWIPVEERLPEEKQRVIVRCERVGTSVGWILWGNWMTDIGPGAGKVTHWMPLPQPPKEESNEQDMQ